MNREQVKKRIRKEFYKKDWSPIRVRDLIERHLNDSQIDYCDVLDIVSEVTGITREQMLSTTRKREYVIARQVAAYFLVRHNGYNLTRSGKEVGRDHSTIIHYLRKVDDALYINDELIVKPITLVKEKIDNLVKK